MEREYEDFLRVGEALCHRRSKDFDWDEKLREERYEMQVALQVYQQHPTHDSKYLLLLEIADYVAVASVCSYLYRNSTLVDALSDVRGIVEISTRQMVNLVKAKLHIYVLRDLPIKSCSFTIPQLYVAKDENKRGVSSLPSGLDPTLNALLHRVINGAQLTPDDWKYLGKWSIDEESVFIRELRKLLDD